jgi:hypothetical protein
MATSNRLKQIILILGITGFTSTIFLCGLALILATQTGAFDAGENGIVLSGGGFNIYKDMLLRYCLISICYVLVIAVFFKFRKLLKVTGLIPLALIMLQGYILISLKGDNLQGEGWKYTRWLEVTYYGDFCIITLAFLLLILNLYSIWNIDSETDGNIPL